MHQALAVSEIALCTVLLIAAFLIAQSLVHVLNANVWANVSRVVTVSLTIPANRYQKNSLRERLYNRLLDGARNVPGVEAAGIVNALPFKGEMWGDDVEFLETPKPEKHAPNANWRLISPDYFRAAGVPLKKGRYLSQSDWGRHLIVISERLARQLPGHINPVGAHVSWKPPSLEKPVVYEVVGVVADTRATPDEEAPFTVYVPYWEEPPWGAALVVRAGMDAPSVAASLQQLVRNTDREIAIPGVETMQDILSKAVAPRRFVTFLGLTFAASATFLAALGLYGLLSLAVSQRTREIGVRLAIGAQTEQILKMMISQAIGLAAVGLSCGVVCAWAATRFLRAFLYEVKPADPFTFAGVCAALLLVSIAASYVPARRATKVDPVRALKWE
jgi:predicted permease